MVEMREDKYENEEKEGRRDKFIEIHKNNWWMSKQSKSGEGSERNFAERIEKVLDRLVVRMKRDLGKDTIR